jgi:hypothetical protein
MHTEEEFLESERLGQVVVAARLQAPYAVIAVPFGREKENRNISPGGPRLLTNAQAIQSRQHHIEHNEIEFGFKNPSEGR